MCPAIVSGIVSGDAPNFAPFSFVSSGKTNMPIYNCCVPLCSIGTKTSHTMLNFTAYPRIQKYGERTMCYLEMIVKNLIDSDNTRVCSVHWEGGRKLSGTHLSTVFPWTTAKKKGDT